MTSATTYHGRSGWLALALLVPIAIAQPTRADDRQVSFSSPRAALQQGIGAYRGGVYAIARPALSYAAARGSIEAQYYLGRLYADNSSNLTNHVKAYELFRGIVEQHASRIDIDDDPAAKFVGNALTAYANYVRAGIGKIGLLANAERAATYLQQAATFFRNADAQFELAKMYLTGDGVPQQERLAHHWFSTLAQQGHSGAQAFLADLYARGKIAGSSPERTLALITTAVANAPPHERIWIEDIYQNIFCGMSAGTRKQADGLISSYLRNLSPRGRSEIQERTSLGMLTPNRVCADGSPLPFPEHRTEMPASSTPKERTSDPAPRGPSRTDDLLDVREPRSR